MRSPSPLISPTDTSTPPEVTLDLRAGTVVATSVTDIGGRDPAAPIGLRQLVGSASAGSVGARGSMADADALIIFDFGTGTDGSPGQANAQLASLADQWPDLPVLAQRETATALARRGRMALDIEHEARHVYGLGRSAYLSTAHVARTAARVVRAAGWRTVAVLGHPGHVTRCVATVEATGLTAVMPEISRDRVDFDPDSGQWWTRSARLWLGRELAVIAQHRLTGQFGKPPA